MMYAWHVSTGNKIAVDSITVVYQIERSKFNDINAVTQ